jgi:hypothetical protein
MDSNDLNHIFGNPRHRLERMIQQFGSAEAAGHAIQEAVDAAFAAGELPLNAHGVFERTFDIGGNQVTVRGVIHASRPRVGSAWIFA